MTIAEQQHRAELVSARIRLDDVLDRKDTRPTRVRVDNGCPTCDDGVLTITHPRRCRECIRSGL